MNNSLNAIYYLWNELYSNLVCEPFCNSNQVPAFAITDTKPYVPAVTLSNKGNAKLSKQLNWVLKELLTGININQKLEDKSEIDPRFKSAGLNRVFVIPNNLQVKSTIFIQL